MAYRILPPLNALRAFEAAARHLSVKRAAQELGVTPGAVSRQVAHLEQYLGYELFARLPGGLALRARGATLLTTTTEALDMIAGGVARSSRTTGRSSIRIGVASIFASRWLIPRWQTFLANTPRFELEVTTANDVLQLSPHRFDAVITVGDGQPVEGLVVLPLLPVRIVPVCAPGLLGDRPFDLRRHRLLHSRQRPQDWRRWLKAARIDDVDPDSGIFLESITLAIDAATEGLGVALAVEPLIAPDVRAGRVVVPIAFCRTTRRYFQLVHRDTQATRSDILALTEWLLLEKAGQSQIDRLAGQQGVDGRPSPARTVR